jgi:hypothetical protein
MIMGHVRLGRLPATRQWREVVSCLELEGFCLGALADAVARASNESLEVAMKDRAFVEALWLLIRIPQAARSHDFAAALAELGINVPANPSIADVVAGYDNAIGIVQRKAGACATDLGELAKHAGIAALYGLAREQCPSLWQPSSEDERTTVATLAAPERFAELAQRFFTHLIEHNIHYFLDREMPKHIGPDKLIHSVPDLKTFDEAIGRHCRETTIIMRTFARDWLGKNVFQSRREMTRQDVAAFAHVAFQKVRKELTVRNGSHA